MQDLTFKFQKMQLNWIYRIALFALCNTSLININAISPELLKDISLIENSAHKATLEVKEAKNPKRKYLINKNDNLFVRMNPIYHVFGGLLYFYQTSLSRQFSADCLYEPTCSSFSLDVISHYGPIKGLALTADRLCRCNRIAQTDLHPITINEKTHRSKDSYLIYRNLLSKPDCNNCRH